MDQFTDKYEGNELKEDRFKGDNGAAEKVKELKGNGKICNGDEKVTHFLANQDVVMLQRVAGDEHVLQFPISDFSASPPSSPERRRLVGGQTQCVVRVLLLLL